MYKFTIWFNSYGCGTSFEKKTKVATVVADTLENAKRKVSKIANEERIQIVKYDFEEIVDYLSSSTMGMGVKHG